MAGKTASDKPELRPLVLREAMTRKIMWHAKGIGQMVLRAAPSMLDHYMKMLEQQFSLLGRKFNEEELTQVRNILSRKVDEGFRFSPHCWVIVDFRTDPMPQTTLSYEISLRLSTVEDEYQDWVNTRKPPLFGAHADAKVLDTAKGLGQPSEVRVLDVGAGTGRNSLPLARAGHSVVAVELAPALAEILRKSAGEEGLDVKLMVGNVLDDALELPPSHFQLVVMAEVVASHFREQGHVHHLFERIADTLAPGGIFLLNAFLCHDGYTPDRMARELSQLMWSVAFTRHDFAKSVEGLPFERLSDESAHDYEKTCLPAEAWPPTGWYESWSTGRDIYVLKEGRPPVELRWLAYRRK